MSADLSTDYILVPLNQMPNIGELGEQLVAKWLQTQGWVILHRRWRCRWGEIDLIAQQEEFRKVRVRESTSGSQISPFPPVSSFLAFVEVKTRGQGNWDADGMLAITRPKRTKLRRTAELFLSQRPNLANLPCRFDVALVNCRGVSQHSHGSNTSSSPSAEAFGKAIHVPPVQLGQPVLVEGYQLILQDYIQSAFD